MNDELKYNLELKITPPFSLEQTLFCGQAFRWQKKEGFFDGVALGKYIQVKQVEATDFTVVFEQRLILKSNEPLDESVWKHYFSLDIDYASIQNRFTEDDMMRKCVENAPGIRILNQDFFEVLISFIISQNNNITRIRKIVDSFCRKYGEEVYPNHYTFPTIQSVKGVTIEDLAELKAGFRAKYIVDAINVISNNMYFPSLDSVTNETGSLEKNREFSDKWTHEKLMKANFYEVSAFLQSIKGVGQKVSDCVLLFSLCRYEAFPKDVWIKKAMSELFPQGLPHVCSGYEGIAQQYIFEYIRNRE